MTQSQRMIHSLPFSVLMLTALLTAPAGLVAQEEEPKPPKLFESQDTLEITLAAPWQDLVRNKSYQGNYPATIVYRDPDGREMTHPLTVERRGIKRQDACRFPPIRLRFEKGDVKGSVFRGQTSLKMVTHCEQSQRFDQYYRLEMLAYRIYNLLTDYSFRVRPLSVTYKDNGGGKDIESRFAFLIEDDSDVAKRNDLKKLKIPRISHTRLERDLTGLFALYQLMIGNVDWSALSGPDPEECCHNVKLIANRPLEKGDPIYPIPYDYDSAGIVNAPYAAPPGGLGINSVTQRLYRGFCIHNDTLPGARELIRQNKTAILALINEDPVLNSGSKKKTSRYLEKYFDIIEDDKDFDRQVVRKCRK